MSSVHVIKSQLRDLEILLNSDPHSVQLASLLRDLKKQTCNLPYASSPFSQSINTEELTLVREFNELNVIFALKTRNQAEYDNAMSRLRVTYHDSRSLLPKSSNENLLIAVYLLSLLSNNKIQEFHVGVESVPSAEMSDKHIVFVASIEQSLTLGNYKEVLNCKRNSTHEFFNVFLERILETIRFEIARSAEKAYTSLALKDVLELFQINSEEVLVKFVKNQESAALENGVIWRFENKRLYFDLVGQKGKHINADGLIMNMLNYAQDLEKII